MLTALDEPRSCPGPMELAAFLEGSLDEDSRRVVVRHIEHCDRCIFAIRETSRFERETNESERSGKLLPIAAGFVIAILSAAALLTMHRDPVRRLQAAVTREGLRDFEGRLAGFDFTRYQSPRSSPSRNVAIVAAAEAVLSDEEPQSANDWHAQGVAHLLLGRASDAVSALTEATHLSPRSSPYRSDLAAARIALGTDRQDANELRRALVDADHALKLDPNATFALYNRAVAFERLGDTAGASRAYAEYLSVDAGSPWADEARWRMKRLGR